MRLDWNARRTIGETCSISRFTSTWNWRCANAYWFEMPFPAEWADRPYHKDAFRIDAEGYVQAPTQPGLGYPIDRDALDKMIKRIDR